MSEEIEEIEKSEKSKHRDRGGRVAARKRSYPLLVAGHAFRRAAEAAGKSGEPILATADGKEAATALLKAALKWRNEAQQYATYHSHPWTGLRRALGAWRLPRPRTMPGWGSYARPTITSGRRPWAGMPRPAAAGC